MSALTHALDDHLNLQRGNNDTTNGRGSTHRKNGRNSSDSTSTSSPEFSPEVTLRDGNKTHGSGSAIALLRATVWEEAQKRGENFGGREADGDDDEEEEGGQRRGRGGGPMIDAKTRAILETENAEQMFVGRRSMEIEQVASFGNIQIAPAVSGPQTQAFSGISSRPREVPRVRRVTVYDDMDEDSNDASSPGRKRRGASTSYLAIEADLLSRSDENVGMFCSSPNRKNFTSAPFAAVFAAGRTSTGVGSPSGQPSSPKSTSKGFYSAPFATVYGSPNAPSSPASKMNSSFHF